MSESSGRSALLRPRPTGATYLAALAIVVGALSGLFAVFFRWLVDGVTRWGTQVAQGPWSGGITYLLLPVGGGLAVGLITYWLAREAKGHGVPEVMYAVAVKGGRIRPRVPLVKAVASAITLGTGGSAGAEGPIVQIGAGIGSAAGQWFRMSDDRTRTLVACGAAAGIAAMFNAPIAGTLFALEVILGEFTAGTFSLVVIASVASAAVAHGFWGDVPVFNVARYELVHPAEFMLYAALGLVAALMAWLYVQVLYALEDGFDRWRRAPDWVKPAAGGLLFGAVGWLLPHSFGPGYDVMDAAVVGNLPWLLMGGLALVKILTTSLTLGSGGSGGVFAPSLFIGTMTGGAFGWLVHTLWPAATAEPGAYALVGMAAVFAGATQAPITAILTLFEMTRDYRIILPLMLATVIASMVAGALRRETIYTLKLVRRGINLRAGRDVAVLRRLKVADAMAWQPERIPVEANLSDVVQLMQETRRNGFPVTDAGGRLVGIITLADVRNVPLPGRLETPVVRAMTRDVVTVTPDDTLEDALHRLTFRDVGRLPVVEGGLLVGVLTRSDILKAYDRALMAAGGPASGSQEPAATTASAAAAAGR